MSKSEVLTQPCEHNYVLMQQYAQQAIAADWSNYVAIVEWRQCVACRKTEQRHSLSESQFSEWVDAPMKYWY